MPRARMNKDGIWIARAGFNVDTAGPANTMFSPLGANQVPFLSGTIPSATSAQTLPNLPSQYASRYGLVIVAYGKTFAVPPIVHILGIAPDGSHALVDTHALVTNLVGAWYGWEPYSFVVSRTTYCEIWTRRTSATIGSWRYMIMENGT